MREHMVSSRSIENTKYENVGKVMCIFYREWKNIISKIHETNI